MLKNVFKVVSIFSAVLWLSSLTGIFAQEENVTSDSTTTETVAVKDWKQEIFSDKQQAGEQKENIRDNSQAARDEEKILREQIRQAENSGDSEQAKSLRNQLGAMHQENLQQRQQDFLGLKEAKEELRSDVKEARKEKIDTNKDGQVDNVERRSYDKRRADANRDGTVDQTEKKALQDRREIRGDMREIQKDHKEIREDNREIRQERREGDIKGLKQDVRELKKDQRDLKNDQIDLKKDRGDKKREGQQPSQGQVMRQRPSGSPQGGGPKGSGPRGGGNRR